MASKTLGHDHHESQGTVRQPPSSISFTGDFHAAYKLFYNVKYASEICSMSDGIEAFEKRFGKFSIENASTIPIWEARYKTTNSVLERLIRQTGTGQVVELAAGMSPRGLSFTEQFPNITYIETDLKGALEKKKAIVASLIERGIAPERKNLKFSVLDATNIGDFHKISRMIDPSKPVIFVVEGLLPYYDLEEITQILENIRSVHREGDLTLVTPDLSDTEKRRAFMKSLPGYLSRVAKVRKETGRHPETFIDRAAAERFAIELGWTVAMVDAVSPNEILSLKKMKSRVLARALAEHIKEESKVWLLSVSTHHRL
jgi:O-methyltransferase involved in polyketide biosynthesis